MNTAMGKVVVIFCLLWFGFLDGYGQGFHINKGINISHWLSQSKKRGADRVQSFAETDVVLIKGMGFDHLRLPVDEVQLWDSNGRKHTEAFELMHKFLGWAQKQNLRVIVDLHILRSHYFNSKKNDLWEKPEAQERFYQCWRELSEELKTYPNSFLAYELMNEPVAPKPDSWNQIANNGLATIRKKEPNRKVVIGSNMWQDPGTFDKLSIPAGDSNIILSFHFYSPFILTHYTAAWTPVALYKGKIEYPGNLVDTVYLKTLPQNTQKEMANFSKYDNKEELERLLRKPLDLAKKMGLKLYCGEWGCYKDAPAESRLRWYKDVAQIFKQNNVDWTLWDYKGNFGVVENGKINEALLNAVGVRK